MAKYVYQRWDFMPDLSAFFVGEKSDQMDVSVQLLNKNGNLSGIFTTVRNMRVGEICMLGAEGHPHFRWWEEGRDVQFWAKKSSTSYDVYNTKKSNFIASLSPTVLIEEFIAEEGTYPDNGIHGDFWYIKKGLVETFSAVHVKVGTAIKKATKGYVKTGGVLKEIKEIYVKKDGQLKKGI